MSFKTLPRISVQSSTAIQDAVVEALLDQTKAVLLALATGNETLDSVSALLVLLNLPKARRAQIVLHPTFRYWLRAMQRTNTERTQAARRGFLQEFIGFVCFEKDVQRVWRARLDNRGGLRCPATSRFVEFGRNYANQEIQVTPQLGEFVVQCVDGLTVRIPHQDFDDPVATPLPSIEENGYCLRISPRVCADRIEVSTRDPWLRVVLTGTNQRTDGTEFFGVGDIYPEDFSIRTLASAFGLIRRHWVEQYEDLAKFTRVIVPIVAKERIPPNVTLSDLPPPSKAKQHMAFTVSSRQGAIYIGDAPVDPTIEMLLHENAHVKLRQIQEIDPLLRSPLDESIRVPVPWRSDPRPIPGVLEGLFVFAHVLEFDLRRWQDDHKSVDSRRILNRMRDLEYAVDCLVQNASLTSQGANFVVEMKYWLSELRSWSCGQGTTQILKAAVQ